jgi:hypothetical protein
MEFYFKENKLDRINQSSLRYAPARRIVRIMRPSAERPLAVGEKIPDIPVNPV